MAHPKDVVIVAAKAAYPESDLPGVHWSSEPCASTRSPSEAFYTGKVIQLEVPAITEVRYAVQFSRRSMSRLYSTGKGDRSGHR